MSTKAEDSTIEQLVTVFGFPRDRSREAVDAIGDKRDVQMAYNWLLDHGEEDRGGPVDIKICEHADHSAAGILEPMRVDQEAIKGGAHCSVGCPSGEVWMCLCCGEVRCSRYVNGHNLAHFKETLAAEEASLTVEEASRGKTALGHFVAIGLRDLSIWCYHCSAYVTNPRLERLKKQVGIAKFGESIDVGLDVPCPSKEARNIKRPPTSDTMLGGIVGDIAGSTYEDVNCKSYDKVELFAAGSRFTDDSVLTLATADRFVTRKSYVEAYRKWGHSFPFVGYGPLFRDWLASNDPKPYHSWGNGSAMRVSPIGWAVDDLDGVLDEAKRSAEVTHNHPEGIRGAQAVAAAVYLARTGESKQCISCYVSGTFGYDLDRTVEEIRPGYDFEVSCQGSVPEAIIAFLDSSNFEDAIRKAISLGGDSDTIACITGAISHAFYGSIPKYMVDFCRGVLTPEQLHVLDEFWKQFGAGTEKDSLKK